MVMLAHQFCLVTQFCCNLCFFRFPSNPEQRRLWTAALRRKDFHPSITAVVCSKHFHDADFDRTSLSYVRIRPNAVPSVLSAFPSHLQPKQSSRKAPKDRYVSSVVVPSGAACTATTPVKVSTQTDSVPPPATPETLIPVTVLQHVADDDGDMETHLQETPRKAALKWKLADSESRVVSQR